MTPRKRADAAAKRAVALFERDAAEPEVMKGKAKPKGRSPDK